MSSYTFSAACSMVLCVSLVVFQLFLATSLIRKLYFGPNKFNLSELSMSKKLLQFSAIAAYILLASSGISVIILNIYNLSLDVATTKEDEEFMAFRWIYLLFMSFAYLSSYSFMICRLYTTFKDSMFAIKQFIINIHIVIVIFTMFCGIMFLGLIYGGYDGLLLNILYAAMVFMTIFALIHLIYSFNNKLFKLVLIIEQKEINNTASSPSSIKGQTKDQRARSLSDRQITMLSVIRRQTLLGVSAISMAFLCIIVFMIAVSITHGQYHVLSTYKIISAYIVIFDIFNVFTINIASLSIYLGFSVNKNHYIRFCNYLDSKCKILCEAITHSKLNDIKIIEILPQTPQTPQTPQISQIPISTAIIRADTTEFFD